MERFWKHDVTGGPLLSLSEGELQQEFRLKTEMDVSLGELKKSRDLDDGSEH